MAASELAAAYDSLRSVFHGALGRLQNWQFASELRSDIHDTVVKIVNSDNTIATAWRGNPAQRGGWRGRNRGSPRFNPKDIRAIASLLADTSDKAEPAPSTSSGKKKEGAAADSAASAASAAKRILAVIAAESEGYEHGEDPEPYSGQEGPDDYYHPGDDPYPADQGGMFWPGDDSHDQLFH